MQLPDCLQSPNVLHLASQSRSEELVKYLVEDCKMDVNAKVCIVAEDTDLQMIIRLKDERGSTAVMFAAEIGDIAITQYLIDAGADITIRNTAGMSVFEAACYSRKEHSLKVRQHR
jgi:ankyrin repeat protein